MSYDPTEKARTKHGVKDWIPAIKKRMQVTSKRTLLILTFILLLLQEPGWPDLHGSIRLEVEAEKGLSPYLDAV
jgi:hypothetical protein